MNEYDDLIAGSMQPNPAQAARVGFTAAVDSNPDSVAEARRVAQRTGVPIDTVLNMPVEMKRQDAVGSVDFDTLAQTSPATAALLADVDKARIAHDNVDSLSGIEQAFTVLKNTGSAAVSGLRSASAGAVGLLRMPFDLAAPLAEPLVGTILPNNPFTNPADGLGDWQRDISGRAKAEMPKADGNLGAGYYSGIASLSRNLAALPMAFLPGGQGAALGAMVAPVGGEAYGEARDQGKGIGSSLTYAGSQAAIEYATEKLPLSWLLKDLKAGTGFLKTLGKQALSEVPGEQIATIFQDLNEWAVINPDKPFSEYLAERPDAAAQTLIATLVGTGGQVSVMQGISSAIGYADRQAQKAQHAEQGAAMLENLSKMVAADKLLQRDPETFQSFIAAAAEDGPVQNVFIDGKMLMQSGMAPALAEMSPAVRDQLDRAILTGGQIAIPVDEYATRIAPTDLAPQLLDHLKTEADGFTRAEAQDFMANQGAELQAEVERILTDRQDADTFRASQDVVKQDILGQLNTAGRFTPQVNEAYATLASAYTSVRAAQLGMTPEAFHAERGMRVQGAAVAGEQFSQDGRTFRKPATPEFKEWYGRSKVKSVMYHATAADFDAFNTDMSDLGAHFGTIDQANYLKNRLEGRGGMNIMPVWLSIKNPLRLKDTGTFHADGIAIQLEKKGLLKKGEGKRIEKEIEADWKLRKKYDPMLKQIMQDAGYDGVVYKNEHEGAGDSFIAFDPTQIKSAIGNRGTFDPNDPNILNQSANGSKELAVTRLDSVFEGDHLKQAEQFYKQNVQGKTVDNPSIGEVRFSAEGLGKMLSSNRESALRASVVKVLPELMANAELTDFDIDRKWRGHVEGFKYLIAPLEHDGKLYAVRMTVKQGQQGGGFYTLEGFKADTLSALVGQNASYPGSEGTSSSNPTVRLGFLEGEVNELNRVFQPDGTGPRGAFSPATNTVTLLKNADLTTFLHESAHYFFESDIQLASELIGKSERTPGEQQLVNDVSRLLTWHGIQGDVTEQLRQWHTMDFEEQRSHHERTAESFEAYLFSGKAPNLELQPIFQRFRAWMVSVYKSLKDFLARNPEAGKLNDEVRGVFDRMIATQEQIALAEQARSLTALFASQDTSGMTPEAFAAYQALGVDATNTAIDELQAKGLRDMQWLHNARGRAVKKLQKQSRAARSEVMMEARREVMSQPVYRAWDFLTRKMSADDKLPPLERKSDPDILDPTLDSLFVAIAKLGGVKNDQVLSEWGVDPKDFPQSGLFGKPVWRIDDGMTLDGMAEALAQHGYLPLNKHGQYEISDLEERFLEELRGNTQYSIEYDYEAGKMLPGDQVVNPEGLNAGRLDLAGLADIDAPAEVTDRLKTLKMTATDGMHPDLVATMFEFSSGDELVRAIAESPTPKDAINALADQMMLESFGELSSPDAIERAADQAIHNDVRARMLTTEANALSQAIGKPKILASAAKAFAADMIARLKVRDVRPGQYANAEARAAKAAAKAEKAGDVATAATEKRNQIIQHYATRAAYDAQDEVTAGLRYLKKFDKRSKTIDPEYQDQIEAMLERFELRAISNKAVDRRTSLAQWLTAQREAGLEPDISPELENEAFRTSYKNITVEEFRGLVDAVKQIEHLGRLKNKLMTAQDQRAFKVIAEEVATSIIDNGGKARPVELETPRGIRPWLDGLMAGHRKMASLIRQMDGLKDGGPFWRVLVRGMNEAATNEAVMIEQATVKLAELYKPMLALKGGLTGDKRFIPAINDSLTRGGRLSVALNWGNTANRQRVMDGDHWTEHQVHAILSTLSREEWSFVQNVWTFIDSYWPAIEAKEKRVTGRAPDKVAAEPFTYMVDGEMISLSGGYYPIKYDSNRDDKAEKHDAAAVAQDMMRGAMTRSTTRRGHTKERMAAVNRPVKKTLDVITQHVSEVTHDLAWHEWLVDANRLLDAKPINQAIRDHYGTEVLRTMKDALTSIATADIIPQDRIDRALLYLRANVSRSTMGFSLTTAFLQPFGLLQSMVRIGTKPVLRGMARWVGDAARFESSMTWIAEKSEFMRLRGKTFNRELHEIKGRVSQGHSKARTIYDASLFMLMRKMQMVADVPTWIGAYEKALAENHDDATAVALADQAVLDAQGGGQTKDMAQFPKSWPTLTMFYSYFNTTFNLAAESTAATNFKNPLAVAGWAADMALLMVIPALGPAMLLALMKGEDCEGEECAVKLARAQGGYLLNLMLGLREFSGLTSGFDYAGPPVGRVVTELQRTSTQIGQGEADEALATSAISLLGVSLGIPTTQILRSYRGWKAWEDGDAPATSILMGPPPKE